MTVTKHVIFEKIQKEKKNSDTLKKKKNIFCFTAKQYPNKDA